ncbi:MULTISPECIES: hypothetical protein [unclassified Streptomyces]|uniref:hypothetical protein n=1 Tax=unclassified Streptomyces TaxID=2593676 RepID=UPI002E337550|nr:MULTISPECIES: hypothetical protein [unclassified Streptomyces]WUC65412.1 hypothetical protein OG861_14765 [Streptomyces sp. NBC_00539]
MPGPRRGPRFAAAFAWAVSLVALPPSPAWARPVGSADGPADVALAIAVTTAAAIATGLWLRSRYRRDEKDD